MTTARSTRAPRFQGARSHTLRAATHGCLLAACLWGCGEQPATDGGLELAPPSPREIGDVERDDYGIPLAAPVSRGARERIGALLEDLIPPDLDETSDVQDAWIHAKRAHIEELMGADEEVGHAALHAFCGEVSDYTATRWALLRIGAATAPTAAAPLLRELMLTFGFRTDDRAEATLLYAQADPEGFLVDAEPYVLRQGRKTKSMPADEFLVRGWIEACARTERSPVMELAQVATNLWMDPYARVVAVEGLASHGSDSVARQALETCLIESTGDGNLRRKAAQSIRAGWTREGACALLEDVLSREADIHFAEFLTGLIHAHCSTGRDE